MKKYNLDFFTSKVWAFALVKENEIFYKSKKQRLEPLLFCLRKYKKQMRGARVFDKVVGCAAARLLLYGRVSEVLTPTISRRALLILQRGGAKVEYRKIVKNILNQKGDDLCPMEKLSRIKSAKNFIKFMKV
jgi:hypothetical protein